MEIIKVKFRNKNYKIRKAQSTIEYAMMIACLAAALLGMQFYVKRSLQGRFKEAGDDIGEQYSATNTTSCLTQTITQNVNINGVTEWKTDSVTGKIYEIVKVARTENSKSDIPGGSYEETGALSKEKFY